MNGRRYLFVVAHTLKVWGLRPKKAAAASRVRSSETGTEEQIADIENLTENGST